MLLVRTIHVGRSRLMYMGEEASLTKVICAKLLETCVK